MEKVLLIRETLAFLEANLNEDIKTEEIAKRLHCSRSSIEKLFRFVTNMGIKDYSKRRRMSRAAKDMALNPEVSLLDLAIKYGYSSNEAFTRAFKSVWHTNPSEYRKDPVHFELFPAFNLDQELMEDEAMKSKKKVDISELYDYFKKRQNCYIVGVDIKSLVPINEIAREAGDMAILIAFKRLEMASGEEDIAFRIGGDEFVLLTNSEDQDYANHIINEVLSHNGESFRYGDVDIPLTLYATSYRLETKNLRYAQLFSKLQNELDRVK